MAAFTGWVDKRIRVALDYAADQLDDPETKLSKAAGRVATDVADRVGDRLDESIAGVADRMDQSLAKLPQVADQVGDRIREDIRGFMHDIVPDTAAMAQQVIDGVRGLFLGGQGGGSGGGILGDILGGRLRLGPQSEYRDPEGH